RPPQDRGAAVQMDQVIQVRQPAGELARRRIIVEAQAVAGEIGAHRIPVERNAALGGTNLGRLVHSRPSRYRATGFFDSVRPNMRLHAASRSRRLESPLTAGWAAGRAARASAGAGAVRAFGRVASDFILRVAMPLSRADADLPMLPSLHV